MRLAVSNIAFPPDALPEALSRLRNLGVSGLEVAPFNVFGRWDVRAMEIQAFRAQLADAGFACSSLQGIVYGLEGLHLFASAEQRDALAVQLERVARMAGGLGAGACVFGAPRLRDPGDLEPARARAIAVDLLRRVAPAFAGEGATLAFEANATRYGCRFVTTTAEAIDLVSEVASPGVGLQIDTGTVFLEGEAPAVLTRAAAVAAHVQVSEPDLVPLGQGGVDHRPLAAALQAGGYDRWLSVEMRQTPAWRTNLDEAVALVRAIYLP